MKSELQLQASRANGAKSKGPVTPQGKANSSRNNTRHGLLARGIVLESESEARFDEMLQRMIRDFQPQTDAEMTAVEAMASARWRGIRSSTLQKLALDREIAQQPSEVGPAPVRAANTLMEPVKGGGHETLLRYECIFERLYARARLEKLQSGNARRSLHAFIPEYSPYTFSDDAGTIRTQEVAENTDPPERQNVSENG